MPTNVTLPWVRSADYKLIRSTAATVAGVDIGLGPQVVMHFTTNWPEIRSESFEAEIDPVKGSTRQLTPSQFQQEPVKIVEATALITPETAAQIVTILLGMFPIYSDQSKQQIMIAISAIPVPGAAPNGASS